MALKVKVKYNCTNDRTSYVPIYKSSSSNGSFAGDLFIILFVEKMFIASSFTIFSFFPCFFILQIIQGVNGTVVRKNSEWQCC